jgi:cytochrome c biogenesis protein CcdA/glutaredoxin
VLTGWFTAMLMVAAFNPGIARATTDDQGERVEVTVFYGEGCPYCGHELEFLADLQDREPLLDVLAYEVWGSEPNQRLFISMAEAHGVEARAVPTTFLDGQVWVGFDSTVQRQIEDTVSALVAGRAAPQLERTTIDVPFVGTVDVGDSSLVAATLLIGFVDGVNPCSFWVLSMLLALVLHSGSRVRTAVVGIVFLSITSALYGLYMLGAYSVLDYANELTWIRLVVALVAGTFGILHLKEFVTDRGISLTIADEKKPDMYRRMRSLARPERSMPAVLGGTAVLAVGVSLAETPCTAGLPLLWTNLVSARDVPPTGVALLFALYLTVFLIDELVIFFLAVFTLRAMKLQEHQGRLLQLVSGMLMLALAATMVLAPELLESVTGTIVVFGAAGLVCLLIAVVDRRVRPPDRSPGGARGTRGAGVPPGRRTGSPPPRGVPTTHGSRRR